MDTLAERMNNSVGFHVMGSHQLRRTGSGKQIFHRPAGQGISDFLSVFQGSSGAVLGLAEDED
jgi:hypothetical protein